MAVLVNANFGQTAGELDFGKLELNETKSLTYSLINVGDELINFEIKPNNDLIIEPINGVIDSKSQSVINVTVIAKQTGNYLGEIRARLISNESGTIVLQLELGKNYKFEVVEEEVELVELKEVFQIPSPEESPIFLVLIVIFIFTMCIFFIAYITGGKKE